MFNRDDVQSWRVLVVDDEPDNLEVICETLEFRGAAVDSASDGGLGVEAFHRFHPNIILVDLSMPQVDGWQMRARLKADPAYDGTPIIALTAHVMAGDRERALAAGFDGYLTKPINIMSVIEDIRAAIAAPNTEKV